jgi:hypothetical protein
MTSPRGQFASQKYVAMFMLLVIPSLIGGCGSSSQDAAANYRAFSSASEDERLRQLPSMRNFNDQEKGQVISAASELDRRVKELESRRGN